MNIETKTIRGDVNEYLNFGWEHTEDTRVRRARMHHTEHVLARSKDMPNYTGITALENKYFNLKAQKKQYEPIDGLVCLVAFLVFIIPGIIYVVAKSNQKNNIDEHNRKIQGQMNKILEEVRPLL